MFLFLVFRAPQPGATALACVRKEKISNARQAHADARRHLPRGLPLVRQTDLPHVRGARPRLLGRRGRGLAAGARRREHEVARRGVEGVAEALAAGLGVREGT